MSCGIFNAEGALVAELSDEAWQLIRGTRGKRLDANKKAMRAALEEAAQKDGARGVEAFFVSRFGRSLAGPWSYAVGA